MLRTKSFSRDPARLPLSVPSSLKPFGGVWREGKSLTQKAQLSPLFVPWELTMWNLILLYGGSAAFQSQCGSFFTRFMNGSPSSPLQLWVQHSKLEWQLSEKPHVSVYVFNKKKKWRMERVVYHFAFGNVGDVLVCQKCGWQSERRCRVGPFNFINKQTKWEIQVR